MQIIWCTCLFGSSSESLFWPNVLNMTNYGCNYFHIGATVEIRVILSWINFNWKKADNFNWYVWRNWINHCSLSFNFSQSDVFLFLLLHSFVFAVKILVVFLILWKSDDFEWNRCDYSCILNWPWMYYFSKLRGKSKHTSLIC